MDETSKHIQEAVNIGNAASGGVLIKADPAFASTVTQRLQPYQRFPRTMRPALVDVADYVREDMIRRTFEDEGPGWRKLSRRTQRERQSLGYNPTHPILKRTGDLYRELTEKNHPKHIEIIKTGKTARIIISGSSDKFLRNQRGSSEFHIPSRPMIPGTGNLPVQDRDRVEITNIMRRAILKVASS